jgi:hypothetical protein
MDITGFSFKQIGKTTKPSIGKFQDSKNCLERGVCRMEVIKK